MVDESSGPEGTVEARFALDQSSLALMEMLEVFHDLKARIRDPEVAVSDGEVRGTLNTLAKARLTVLEEVIKYEERALRKAGLVAEAPLDLDALRASIGGKLDRLRHAQGAGEVSGESER